MLRGVWRITDDVESTWWAEWAATRGESPLRQARWELGRVGCARADREKGHVAVVRRRWRSVPKASRFSGIKP